MADLALDNEIVMLLNQMTPAALRGLMVKVARYLRQRNEQRMRSQQNADGSAYIPRKKGGNKPMLVGYARRIRERVESDKAVVGVFGRMGNFGNVHDKGLTERRIKYPSRNILTLPEPDKLVVLDMIKTHVTGASA